MKKYEASSEDAIERCTKRLAEHLAKEPVMPKGKQMLLDDATPEATKAAFNENNPSLGVISDEAGGIFNGRTFGQLPMMNSLWGGGDLKVNRRSGNFVIKDARLTMALMIQ